MEGNELLSINYTKMTLALFNLYIYININYESYLNKGIWVLHWLQIE